MLKAVQMPDTASTIPSKSDKLLLLAVAKWILACILVIYNRSRSGGVYFLAAALAILSLYDINHHLSFGRGSKWMLALVYHHVAPLQVLVGPLILSYVRSTLSDRARLRPFDALHSLPFWIVLVDLLPYLRLPFRTKLLYAERIIADINAVREPAHHLFLSHFSMNLLRSGLALAYCLVCLFSMYRYVKSCPEHLEVPRRQSRLTLRWMALLIGCLTVVSLSYLLLVLDTRNQPLSSDTFEGSIFFILILVFYFVQSTSLLFFPEILYGLPRASEFRSEGIPQSATTDPMLGGVPSQSSVPDSTGEGQDLEATLKEGSDPFEGLAEAIITYLHSEKPYLSAVFSITDITLRFGVPRHHVEYCFSRLIGERFIDMRKRLRVEEAMRLLPSNRNMSVDGVGRECGFASKSVFYGAFREIVGVTPAEYVKRNPPGGADGGRDGLMPIGDGSGEDILAAEEQQ